MADGTMKQISQINVGDYVLGYKDDQNIPSKVLNRFNNGSAEQWLRIETTRDKAITCTPNHQFYAGKRGNNDFYSEASELVVGDTLYMTRIEEFQRVMPQTITAIDDVTNKTVSDRYDLETETHNYFAGDILVHNSNARFAWRDNAMHCGSRKLWKKEDDNSAWWRALEAHPEVRKFCEEHPDIAVYGELYGPIRSLKYGLREPHIAVFDLLHGNTWLSHDEAHKIGPNLPWVPFVMRAPFNMKLIEELAEQDSLVKTAPQGHIREGVVVKPIIERTHPAIGRVQLKIVSNRYLGKE